MNFQPLGDRVLVKATEVLNKTEGGIIIPDNASKDKPTTAKIQAVGKDVKNVKSGDNIVFVEYSGQEIKLEGETYIVLETKEILGVIK